MTKKEQMDMNRRQFLKRLGLGAGSAMALMAMEPLQALGKEKKSSKAADIRMNPESVMTKTT